MSTTCSTGMVRYNARDTADLAHLVATGMVWRSGPKVLKRALDAIVAWHIERPARNVQPAVDAYLDRQGVARP